MGLFLSQSHFIVVTLPQKRKIIHFNTDLNMKRATTLSALLTMLILSMAFSSCSKDEKIANRLAGGWKGDWGMSYTDRHGYDHDASYSIVEFYPADDFETFGTGYQMDYYEDGPYSQLSFYFDWRVDNKRILITYPANHALDAYISRYDYELKKDHFTGEIHGTPFDLYKVWKYYKWYDYAARYTATGIAVLYWVGESSYYYDTYDYYYYANKRSNGTATDTTAIAPYDSIGKPMPDDMRPIRIFNRFAEKTAE